MSIVSLPRSMSSVSFSLHLISWQYLRWYLLLSLWDAMSRVTTKCQWWFPSLWLSEIFPGQRLFSDYTFPMNFLKQFILFLKGKVTKITVVAAYGHNMLLWQNYHKNKKQTHIVATVWETCWSPMIIGTDLSTWFWLYK